MLFFRDVCLKQSLDFTTKHRSKLCGQYTNPLECIGFATFHPLIDLAMLELTYFEIPFSGLLSNVQVNLVLLVQPLFKLVDEFGKL